MSFWFLGNRNYTSVSSKSLTIRERASFVMFSIAVNVLFTWVHSFWCHLVNSNDCSKTVFKYPDFLSLQLTNIVGILECVLPELNIEESCLLAILLDRNSKHEGQAQRFLSEMYMRNSDGASSCKTDFFQWNSQRLIFPQKLLFYRS